MRWIAFGWQPHPEKSDALTHMEWLSPHNKANSCLWKPFSTKFMITAHIFRWNWVDIRLLVLFSRCTQQSFFKMHGRNGWIYSKCVVYPCVSKIASPSHGGLTRQTPDGPIRPACRIHTLYGAHSICLSSFTVYPLALFFIYYLLFLNDHNYALWGKKEKKKEKKKKERGI